MTENNNNHGSRNLALELVRATEAAAIAAGPWVGQEIRTPQTAPQWTQCATASPP
ncbi:fructose-1,6-bisphosphatase [Rothia aeria]|uniref:Fructose-1,6-bisphosphatase n=1 Tax=Rothia aeria TaxID=172042 RepID=A0A2Z5QY23_9MICC|nr:fructose-1,6-bisphosphatase [Rothia aeria]